MRLDPVTLTSLLSLVSAWLSENQTMEEKERAKPAFEALRTALVETRTYLESIDPVGQPNAANEAWLSELWQDVGVELQSFEPHLAEQCRIVATGGADRKDWTRPEIDASLTSLKNAFLRAQILLDTHGAGDGGKD